MLISEKYMTKKQNLQSKQLPEVKIQLDPLPQGKSPKWFIDNIKPCKPTVLSQTFNLC